MADPPSPAPWPPSHSLWSAASSPAGSSGSSVPASSLSRRAFVDFALGVGVAGAAAISGRVAHALRSEPLQSRFENSGDDGCAQGVAATENGDLDARDVVADGAGARHRMMIFVPRHLRVGERVPLLVLLHGLGETIDESLGAHAWSDRYGLVSAYERLRRPPLVRIGARDDWTDARLAAANARLVVRPFRGFVIACPFMPRLHGSGAIDAYAEWLTAAAMPRARLEASSVVADPRETILGGCSLGGYVGLEIFLRRPALFRGFCGIQSAISEASAPAYATRLARTIAQVGPRDLGFETSTGDPFRAANVALAAALDARGVPHALDVLPGPHDQPWLRESGTASALLWCERGM